MIGGEAADLAGRAIDADPRVDLEGVPLDAALKLFVAVDREPHRPIGKEHPSQRDVKRHDRMIAPAESAAHIGKQGLDVRRLEKQPACRQAYRQSLQRPRKATACRARAQAFWLAHCTSRARFPARETSGRRTASRICGRAPGGPDCPRQVRRGSVRRNTRPARPPGRSDRPAPKWEPRHWRNCAARSNRQGTANKRPAPPAVAPATRTKRCEP